jgi:NADH-quinone oxidoreductase subunit J
MYMIDAIFFYSFALLTLAGGILTITRKSAVHSAIWLIVSLLGVAGLYLLQHAEFLFAVQIILYIGGIMLLFLFVIMLVNLDQAAQSRQFNRQWPLAVLVILLVAGMFGYFLRGTAISLPAPAAAQAAPAAVAGAGAASAGNVEMLADVLFSEYLLPFELVSILLLVAIVGSVIMAKKRL